MSQRSFVLFSLVLATCLSPAVAQIVLRESLTEDRIWTHLGGATTVPGSSRFGKVDRLRAAGQFSYTRTSVSLQPGTYRARFRLQKFGATAQHPLVFEARSTLRLARTNLAVTKVQPGWWQWSPALEFTLAAADSVTFSMVGGSPFRVDRNWLFDSFELRRVRVEGGRAEPGFGRSMDCVGDVNGDGYDDIVVGADEFGLTRSALGVVKVLSGKDARVLYRFPGESALDYFGHSVAGAGDVDGDGRGDFVVGAPEDDRNGQRVGSARVYSGKSGAVLFNFYGVKAGDRFGDVVAGAGDVNGDGYADILVGCPGDDTRGAEFGCARVFSGKDGKVLHTFFGTSARSRFGAVGAGAGDVNKDGFADLIISAEWENNLSGRVQVFSGKDGKVLYTFGGVSGARSVRP